MRDINKLVEYVENYADTYYSELAQGNIVLDQWANSTDIEDVARTLEITEDEAERLLQDDRISIEEVELRNPENDEAMQSLRVLHFVGADIYYNA